MSASDEPVEHDDLVDAIEELGLEVRVDGAHHLGLVGARAEVARHDHDGVGEVDRAPLTVGEPAVVHELQQDVEHVRVRLLDLVEQDHRVRPAPDRFGELSAFLVPDIARRRADEPRHGVLLHVLRHVDTHHRPFVVEEELRQGPPRARSSRHPSGRGTGTSRSAGADRKAPRGSAGSRWRRPRPPRPGRSTRSCNTSSRRTSFASSPSMRRETGTPVHLATISATSSSSTSSFNIAPSRWRSANRCVIDSSSRSTTGMWP